MKYWNGKSVLRGSRRRLQNVCESLENRVMLAGDLIAHWIADSLNETVDQLQPVTTWLDRVDGDPAVADGTPRLVKDRFGGRSFVRFHGEDAFEVASAVAPLNDASDFSVTLVFATDEMLTTGNAPDWFQHTALVNSSTLGFGADWGIALDGDGSITTGLGRGPGQPTTSVHSSTTGLNDGALHVVSITRAGDSLSVYVDDAAATTVTGASTAPRSRLNMAIGRALGGSNEFVGDLGELRFFDGALDPAEVASLHADIGVYYNNEAPVANDDAYSVKEDAQFYFVGAVDGLLANDTDGDGDPLTARVVSPPSRGTLSVNPDGSFVYDSDENYFGTDTFTYVANDFRDSNEATVTFNITPVYDRPRAVADSYEGTPDQPVSIPRFLGVLVNDENPDDATLNAVLVDPPAAGSVTLESDGSFVYDPQGFAGTTEFSYSIDDLVSQTAPATVTLTLNTPPQAVDDQFNLTEDGALVITAQQGLLANDIDPDLAVANQTLEVTLVTEPMHGDLTLNADGSFEYIPQLDYFGDDSFAYEISDGIDTSSTATVNLTVAAMNDAPRAEADAYFTPAETPLTVALSRSLLANDIDVDSTDLSASVVDQPTNGQLQLAADGTFSYSPNESFQGVDSFTYRASDGLAASEQVTVSLFVGISPIRINEIMAVKRQRRRHANTRSGRR